MHLPERTRRPRNTPFREETVCGTLADTRPSYHLIGYSRLHLTVVIPLRVVNGARSGLFRFYRATTVTLIVPSGFLLLR
jgi:hypothetical protein